MKLLLKLFVCVNYRLISRLEVSSTHKLSSRLESVIHQLLHSTFTSLDIVQLKTETFDDFDSIVKLIISFMHFKSLKLMVNYDGPNEENFKLLVIIFVQDKQSE